MASIHERIKAARQAKGWSMQRLAAEISKAEGRPIAWQNVQQWENGKSAPQRKRLSLVAALLETSAAALLGAEEQPGPPAPEKGAVFEALSSEEHELIAHWRHLLGKDRRAKLAEIAALSAERLAEREELFEMAGVNRIAQGAANASRTRAANISVEIGPKLRQRSLPLGGDGNDE